MYLHFVVLGLLNQDTHALINCPKTWGKRSPVEVCTVFLHLLVFLDPVAHLFFW